MVKIKNKNYNKLSQLDRIEYSLREKDCEANYSIGENTVWFMMIISSMFLIGGYENTGIILFSVTIYVFIINILLILISIILTKIRMGKLVEEYFEIVTIKRNKK